MGGSTRELGANSQELQEYAERCTMTLAVARQQGVALPAVELIQVGDLYFVRDGHHRVSVG